MTFPSTTLAVAVFLASQALGLPHQHIGFTSLVRRDPVAQLLSIAPSSSSCAGAQFPNECSTAAQSVPYLISSFSENQVNTAPEQAALISWMAYESIEFSVAHNLFPGVPGQGTYSMMSPEFVAKYAATESFAAQAASLASDPAALLDLVNSGGDCKWATAAWFYSAQCSDGIKSGVQSGSQAGWEAFLSQCVGTDPSEGSGDTSRLAYWQRAMTALGA